MRPASKQAASLRLAWERAVERDKPKDALAALEQLEVVEPNEARWPHRAADVLKRMGKMKEAELAYDRAMALYEKQGFMARAIAVAKIISAINPARADVLSGVNHQAARALRAASKPPPVLSPPPAAGTPQAFEIGPRPGPPPLPAPIAPPVPAQRAMPSQQAALAARLAGSRPAPPQPVRSSAPPHHASAPAPHHASAPAPHRASAPAAHHASAPAPHQASASPARPAASAAPTVSPVNSSIGYIAGLPAEHVRLVSSAKPLAVALDVKPDEVRFDNVPEYSTDVDLSEFASIADLPSEYGPAAEEFDVLESPTAERLSLMSGAVLFNDVPKEVASEIARAADLVDLPPGGLVYSEGAPADSLYIIVDGAVREGAQGARGAGGDLTEGEVFGEGCLLEGSVRLQDVRAKGPLLALRIPKSRLDTIVTSHPAVGDVLFELLIKRLVASTVQTSPIFSAFDAETRRDVATLFEVRRAPAGTLLKQEGKRGDGMYILLVGNLELEKGAETTWLPPGSTFGQSSLFSQVPETETVRVTSEAVLLRLPTSSFGSFAMQYPPALAHIAGLGPG